MLTQSDQDRKSGNDAKRGQVMDVFRFTKIPMRANDPTRRYRIVRGDEREDVGEVEVGGDAPDGDTVVLMVTCHPALSDAAREDAMNTARRFLDELVAGWGHQVAEVPGDREWAEQPDGGFRIRQECQIICANP
ncbi:MAG: hypothetical protein JWO38_4510 [Gemmataceae bacterium]|nr:hypothetical protein [Gemmataceae bacterium]